VVGAALDEGRGLGREEDTLRVDGSGVLAMLAGNSQRRGMAAEDEVKLEADTRAGREIGRWKEKVGISSALPAHILCQVF
jgi:hypothetical protein